MIRGSHSDPVQKLNLIYWRAGEVVCYVMHVSIISDNYDMAKAHDDKIHKYNDRLVRSFAKNASAANEIRVQAIILNWRGSIYGKTFSDLKDILTKGHTKLMSIRVLE